MTSPDSLAGLDTSVFWLSNQAGGWVHLLPPLTKRRILCITPYDAVEWMLARECAHLTRVNLEVPVASERTDGANIRRIGLTELLTNQDAAADRWDGLIVHDPEGELVNRRSRDDIASLLDWAGARIAQSGFVYLGIANPWSVQRLVSAVRRRRHRGPVPCSPGDVETLLRRASWSPSRKYPLLLDGSRVVQVLGSLGYRSTKNREKRRERVKELLLGRLGSAHFAAAYALVSLGSHCDKTVLDQLIDWTRQATPLAHTDTPVLKEYLVLAGHKAVITLGPRDDEQHDVVAIMTGDSLATQRRISESATLGKLAQLGGEFRHAFPRSLGRVDIGAARGFFVTRIPGVTLDQDTPALEAVTDAALDFLIRFHQRTAASVVVDGQTVSNRMWSIVEAGKQRNSAIADDLESWKLPLRRCLEGLTLPLVWMHGDYKIENVMYDARTYRLTGVIDWEHAMIPGLPLLDALYLLVFNRHVRGVPLLDAVRDVIVDGMTALEKSRIDRYCSQLAIPSAARPALEALFFVHHVGHRIHMGLDTTGWQRYRSLLERIGKRLIPAER
ncbi:phosphotransferase family protein [Piscinibacter sp.]|uniref:phosphotransferase family protein n=1 Tax=Piscinibacter sp. TaxID=1903157 RepID=UPI0011D55B80|nr:MAG: aminoglycoside phosphotransferase family protein [Burkholderiaceae bacterium]